MQYSKMKTPNALYFCRFYGHELKKGAHIDIVWDRYDDYRTLKESIRDTVGRVSGGRSAYRGLYRTIGTISFKIS